MKISSISLAQPKVYSADNRVNRNSKASNANNITFGYYGTPRGKISFLTMAGTLLGGITAAVLTGGASAIIQGIAMTTGVIGGAVAGETVNDKLKGK